jgi:hypothetical protein
VSASSERPTKIGPFNAKDATGAQRIVPAPWVDCQQCNRRHYPSTIGGRWHIATSCLSCGAALAVGPAAPSPPWV